MKIFIDFKKAIRLMMTPPFESPGQLNKLRVFAWRRYEDRKKRDRTPVMLMKELSYFLLFQKTKLRQLLDNRRG